MIGAVHDTLRMEAVRLSTVRSTYLLVASAVLVGTLLTLLMGLFTQAGPLSGDDTCMLLTAGGDGAPVSVVGLLVGVLGVTSVTADYRYGLVRAVLVAQPRRGVVLAARLVLLAATAVLAAALVSLLAAGILIASGHRPLLDATTLRVVLTWLGVTVGWAWLGASLGWILRHAAGAVSVLLVVPLVVEPVLLLVSLARGASLLGSVVRWLPFSAARQALGRQLGSDGTDLGWQTAASVFAGATLFMVVLALVVLRRRDA